MSWKSISLKKNKVRITELLSQAKLAIESGETSLRAAAEDIAAAQKQGATQRQIATAVGKSAAWVNRLLGWRKSGYRDDTAFGPQAKASRQRTKRVQSPEQKLDKAAWTKANAEKAKAEAAKAKADAQRARRKHGFFHGALGSDTKTIDSRSRELLVKSLGMLGSDHAGERANAALAVEQQRIKLSMSWDELIIPANKVKARAA